MGFLEGFGKKLGVLDYQGTWNAQTNTPTLSSSSGKKGQYYIVSASGSTALDGISTWETGDWVIHNGSGWQKMDAADKEKIGQLESQINTEITARQAADALLVPLAQKGATNGVATLDSTGVVPSSQLPAYYSGSVGSINNKTGVVTLNTDDIPEGSANLYFTEAKAKLAAVVNSLSGQQTDQSPSVFSVNTVTRFLPENTRYVSKNGSDTTGNGSSLAPFQTIQAAINSLPSPTENADIPDSVVFVYPGFYTESISLTRSNTHIVGLQPSRKNIPAVTISGGIDYNISIAENGGIFQNISSISNCLLTNTAAARSVVNFTGTKQVILHIFDSQIYHSASGYSAIYMNNTAASLSRIYVDNSVVQCVSTGSGHAIELVKGTLWSAFNTDIYRQNSADATARAIKLTNNSSVVGIRNAVIGCSTDYVIELAGTGGVTVGSSTIETYAANKSGVYVSAGAVFTSVGNVFNVLAGTGYAVSGAAGSYFAYSTNVYTANSLIGTNVVKLPLTVDTTTTSITEGTNLYFTNARAKSAAVVNSTSGSETDQAASVLAVKTHITNEINAEITARQAADAAKVDSANATADGYKISQAAFVTKTSSYTLTSSENGKVVLVNSASAVTITVPSGLSVGFSCTVVQLGAGQVTIAASGTTLNSVSGLKIVGQHGAASVISYDTNIFNVSGATTAW